MRFLLPLAVCTALFIPEALFARIPGSLALPFSVTADLFRLNNSQYIYDTDTDLPDRFFVNNKGYDSDRDGLRLFMHDLRGDNPAAYNAMLPYYRSLEADYEIAYYATLTSALVGTGILGAGYALYHFTSYGLAGKVVMIIGGIVDVTALFTCILMPPGDRDFISFFNRYNSTKKTVPIRLKIGVLPIYNGNGRSQISAIVSYQFLY